MQVLVGMLATFKGQELSIKGQLKFRGVLMEEWETLSPMDNLNPPSFPEKGWMLGNQES